MTLSSAASSSTAPLAFSGFQGRAARARIGEHAAVLICPEDRSVAVYRAIGSGVPVLVWNRRAVLVAIPASACLEDVETALRGTDLVDRITGLYRGTAWDGHNNIGRWSGADGELVALEEELREILADDRTVRHYVDAGEWLSPVSADLAEDVAECVRKGARPADAIDAVASAVVLDASGEGAIVDEQEARAAIACFYSRAVYRLLNRTEMSTDGLDEEDVESIVAWIGDDLDSVPCAIAGLCLDHDAVKVAEAAYFA